MSKVASAYALAGQGEGQNARMEARWRWSEVDAETVLLRASSQTVQNGRVKSTVEVIWKSVLECRTKVEVTR